MAEPTLEDRVWALTELVVNGQRPRCNVCLCAADIFGCRAFATKVIHELGATFGGEIWSCDGHATDDWRDRVVTKAPNKRWSQWADLNGSKETDRIRRINWALGLDPKAEPKP